MLMMMMKMMRMLVMIMMIFSVLMNRLEIALILVRRLTRITTAATHLGDLNTNASSVAKSSKQDTLWLFILKCLFIPKAVRLYAVCVARGFAYQVPYVAIRLYTPKTSPISAICARKPSTVRRLWKRTLKHITPRRNSSVAFVVKDFIRRAIYATMRSCILEKNPTRAIFARRHSIKWATWNSICRPMNHRVEKTSAFLLIRSLFAFHYTNAR